MLFRGELSPSAIKYSRNVKSLPVPCAHHLSSTVFCSRFPPLLFVELELQAHIQSGHFGLFFFSGSGQHQLSVPPSVMLYCSGDSSLTWSVEEKQQEKTGSCFLVDVSDVQHSRRDNQKRVDIWHRHAVSHA